MAAPPVAPVSMLTFSRVTLAVAFSSAVMMTVLLVVPLLVMTGLVSSVGVPVPWVTVWAVSGAALTVILPSFRSQSFARTKLGIKAPSSTRDSSRFVAKDDGFGKGIKKVYRKYHNNNPKTKLIKISGKTHDILHDADAERVFRHIEKFMEYYV